VPSFNNNRLTCKAEFYFWNPDRGGILSRGQRTTFNTMPGLCRFGLAVLHQGEIERILLGTIQEHSAIRVERAVLPEKIDFDETVDASDDGYPISVALRHLAEEESTLAQNSSIANGLFRSNLVQDDSEDLIRKGQERGDSVEVVKAKYIFGCDGAHSWYVWHFDISGYDL